MGPKEAVKKPQYSPRKLRQALQAIENGTSVGKAASQYQIPCSTLLNKWSGLSPSETCGKRGYYSVLGKEIEEEIVKWIVDAADRRFPVTMDSLLSTVRKINESRPTPENFKVNITQSKKWYYAFLRRHPEVRRKHAEYVNKARGSVTEEKIRRWFKDVHEQLGEDVEILAHPERIWNMDESGFNLAPTGELVLAPAGRHVYIESRNSDKENITTLFSVNASGRFAPPLTLYKYVRLPAIAASSAPLDWGIGNTDSGWMTAASFYEYIRNVFLPFLDEKKIKKPVIIFLDGHSSHLTLHLSKLCRENGIVLVALYPNSTHILQPLDVAVFKPIKSRWKTLKRQWRINNDGHEVKKFYLPRVLNTIIQEDRMSSNVISGFRATSIFPFDENAVDYSKIIKRTPPPAIQPPENAYQDISLQEMPLEGSQALERLSIDIWESKIDPQMLKSFKATMKSGNPWGGDVTATALFYIWRDIVFEAYHPNLPAFFEEVILDTPDEEVHNSDESILCDEDPAPLNFGACEPDQQDKSILCDEDPAPLNFGVCEPDQQDIQSPVLPIVYWPGPQKKGRTANDFGKPSVITSQQWVNIHQQRDAEKQKKELAKVERKRIRDQKAKAHSEKKSKKYS